MSQMNMSAMNAVNGMQFQLPFVTSLSLFNEKGKINLREIRKQLFGATQEEMANMLSVSVDTYKSWEKEHRSPSGPALSLLRIAVARPDVVKSVLGNQDKSTIEVAMMATA